ncbi:HNH endonuclease signature motif containing protein [Mycobacterium florentinum]|nr:HNH endonuclease signature motif containing protein [Mycobacterium florentinum]MCV7409983.1 HNH endonuclease [Mycobacterium florentinum]
MTVVGLAAWAIGSSSRRARGTPAIPARPEPRRVGRAAPAVKSARTFATIDPPDSEAKQRALVEAAHRCAVPTCRHPTTEIAHIVSTSQSRDDSFQNLIALCPGCQEKEIDPQSIRRYKRNLGILNSRYSAFERRLFDQIAETGRRSFVVQAGLEIPLLHAVGDGFLKRIEPSPVPTQRDEPTHYRYEVADAGLEFVGRYVRGEDI